MLEPTVSTKLVCNLRLVWVELGLNPEYLTRIMNGESVKSIIAEDTAAEEKSHSHSK